MAWDRGWNIVRMNMRGAGDSEALCTRLYHAGVDTDLLAVLGAVAARTPRLAPVGFSLGANLVLLTLGRQAALVPAGVFAAAAVSPPLDLAACADALGRHGNRGYERHYVRNLQDAYRRRQSLLPELYAVGRVSRSSCQLTRRRRRTPPATSTTMSSVRTVQRRRRRDQ